LTHAILTCSEFFVDLALNELKRHHSRLTVIHQFSPAHLYIQAPGSFGMLTQPWQRKLPVYLHHLFPIHETVPLKGGSGDVRVLRRAVRRLSQDEFVVQARVAEDASLAYDIQKLESQLSPNSPSGPDCDAPEGRVLSLLVANSPDGLTGYLGISWANQNISPWAGGCYPAYERVPNRAGLKLMEALREFKIRLRPGSTALDLGAAPGAWSIVMRRLGVNVTAVAPTPMYHWLADDPGLQIVPMLAEAYLLMCQMKFDIITNDMIMDAQDSARLMVAYAEHLKSQGIAIMTLKLRQRNRRRVMDHALRILRKAYKIIRVRQLASNRREVTLFLRKFT